MHASNTLQVVSVVIVTTSGATRGLSQGGKA